MSDPICKRNFRLFRLSSAPLSLLLLTGSLAGVGLGQASKPATESAAKKTANAKDAKNEAAERAARERRATAVSLLATLADDARKFRDERLRARTQARIADALWETEPDQARILFHRAWDAAELADQDSARRAEEERKRQEKAGGSAAIMRLPDLRSEVLGLAAKRDRALGEELLAKLKEARKQEADAVTPVKAGPFDTPAAIAKRLQLADQLLDTDLERSLQFADPALTTITINGLNFLSTLRDKSAAAADDRYARLLAIAGADLEADANTISLLSSYLFTPHQFVMFLRDGGQQSSRMNQPQGPPDVLPELRAAYLRLAAQILLRPLPPPDQDHSSSGIQGKYLVIKRLLPIFDKYAPEETASQLRGELAALSQGTEQDARATDEDEPLRQSLNLDRPEQKQESAEQSLLDRIERAKTAADRDALYVQLAARAVEKGDLRARDFVEKIDDSETRKQAKPYIDVTLALRLIEKKEGEKALTVAHKGELSHIQRVWVLIAAVKLLEPKERDRALGVIGEAVEEARRIDGSDADRPRALVAVANAFAAVDRERSWETMLEVAKAANSGEGFTGEDGRLTMRMETPNWVFLRSSSVDEFDLLGIFRILTKENYTQAIQLARDFEGESPRATAVISIARTILGEKQQ